MAASTENLSRRDRNKHRHQREILAAALDVFAEKGYRNASIQEIANRADFAVSTLYALFDGKADLYRKVSIDIGIRTGTIFEEAMASGKNEYERLASYARAKGRAVQVSPAGARMLMHEIQAAQRVAEEALPKDGIGEIYQRFMKQIETLFAEGIRSGLLVQGDPVLMAMALDSATNGLMQLSFADPENYAYDDRVDEVIALFFESVLADKRQES